ncbi:MAG: hypothetical protein R2851_25255 [Caldilineaceae bacterium]
MAYLGSTVPSPALTNVQVDFATSMVSFERVFEYLDLPQEITDSPHAVTAGRPSWPHSLRGCRLRLCGCAAAVGG